MISITHISLAVAIGTLSGISNTPQLLCLALGSVLPDIDNPRSITGKFTGLLSDLIYKKIGRRSLTHSLLIWSSICFMGIVYPPLFLIGLGGLSHCIIDCWNVKGVKLLYPISDRWFCIGKSKKSRLTVASKGDITLCVFCVFLAIMGIHMQKMGGFRFAIGNFVGSYEIANELFLESGRQVCHLTGTLRFNNGETKQSTWLIVGSEKDEGLALWHETEKKLLHIPSDGQFLKARVHKDAQSWNGFTVDGFTRIHGSALCFFRAGDRWYTAYNGEKVWGDVVYLGDDLKVR